MYSQNLCPCQIIGCLRFFSETLAFYLKPCCFYARFKSFEEPRSPAPHADALDVAAVVAFPQVVKRQPGPPGVFHDPLLASFTAVLGAHLFRLASSSPERRPYLRVHSFDPFQHGLHDPSVLPLGEFPAASCLSHSTVRAGYA